MLLVGRQPDPAVGAAGDVADAACAQRGAGGRLPAEDPVGVPGLDQRLTGRGDEQHVVGGVPGDADGGVEGLVAGAEAAALPQEGAGGGELLDPVVLGVGDVDVAGLVDRHVARAGHLARLGAVGAEAAELGAGAAVEQHAVATGVGHDEPVVDRVDLEAGGVHRRLRGPGQGAEEVRRGRRGQPGRCGARRGLGAAGARRQGQARGQHQREGEQGRGDEHGLLAVGALSFDPVSGHEGDTTSDPAAPPGRAGPFASLWGPPAASRPLPTFEDPRTGRGEGDPERRRLAP